MKFQITLTSEQYATLMTALAFTDATLHEGEFHDRVEKLAADITSSFEPLIEIKAGK